MPGPDDDQVPPATTMLVTCPETAHLEEIGVEHTSNGLLISTCSRFDPAREVACSRVCAQRLDRRDAGVERERRRRRRTAAE